MIAKAKLLTNFDEISKIEQLGIPNMKTPEPEWKDVDFLFRVEHVIFAHTLPNNKLKIGIGGKEVLLEYTEELWDKLKVHITL